MPITKCEHCGGNYEWSWTEAFDKFGFGDGDGQVETRRVEAVLTKAGYAVCSQGWGFHNVIITCIWRDFLNLMPADDDPKFRVGYDNPRDYLPPEIIELLDRELPEDEVLS